MHTKVLEMYWEAGSIPANRVLSVAAFVSTAKISPSKQINNAPP